jgi:hypothetical protein
MTASAQKGLALPAVLLIMSLCALICAFAAQQTYMQRRMLKAEFSSHQLRQVLEGVVIHASTHFSDVNGKLRWNTHKAFEKWKTSAATCLPICKSDLTLSHESKFLAHYEIQIWPIQKQRNMPESFIYRVTAQIRHKQTNSSRKMQAVWHSHEKRWIFWKELPPERAALSPH